MTSLDKQEGGDHYKDMLIQPVEFIAKNNIPFIEGCIIKYACRHHNKNKAEDIRKIIHFAELALDLYYEEEKQMVAEPMATPNKSLDDAEAIQGLVEWNHQEYRGEEE